MMSIPDAPWIQWAERTGYGPYDQPDEYDEEAEE